MIEYFEQVIRMCNFRLSDLFPLFIINTEALDNMLVKQEKNMVYVPVVFGTN
jgi:hypothetical protein